jgi:two-component system, NarL family, sensor histidine kinase DesK
MQLYDITIKRGARKWVRFLPPISRPAPSAYIWLAYSIFFFLAPIYRHQVRYWVECLGVFAIFLLLYVGMDVVESIRFRLGIVGGFVVLGMAALPLNPGASAFYIYAAAFLPFLVASIPIVMLLAAADLALLVGEVVVLHQPVLDYAIAAFFLVLTATTNIFIARQMQMNCKLQMAHEEIEQLAAVAERERIARDLHDVLGHTLSLIVLKAELAGRLLERDPKRAAVEIADVEATARTALAEVREAIGGYRAQGLGAELALARRTLDAAGVRLVCETEAMVASHTLRATEETVLSLAVREAVTNIVRHAQATECRMQLETTEGFHALLVEDDGRHVVRHEGNGLRGMRERVQALGGRFRLESAGGTRLRIELPIELPVAAEHDV